MSLRLGSRGSALARIQAEWVASALGGVEVETIKTADGDVGDKARFVSGIESALLDGRVAIGVHSAKDLPGELPDGLALVGVPGREDPSDALVGATALDDLPEGARVGTSSLRRRSQLLALRPDLEIAELRGNVDTRLARLGAGDYDAIVLATAGLVRLGRADEIGSRFALDQLTPAPGQGCLALEARADDSEARAAAHLVSDRAALVELTAERAAVRALEATCDTPVGVCARFEGDQLVVLGYAGSEDGDDWVRDRVVGDPEQPAALGEALAGRMVAAGAAAILAAAAGGGGVTARPGVVYLVGAGPGDPGLMTARSLELIAGADVILHDRLIGAGALDGARPDAELVYVGKQPGASAVPQEETEALMIERAREGRSVVRLKGGDPFVFGRGGEEAEALAAAGIEFEVVPGVTAGVAAPAYAGIPVTHRDDASAVAFVTGHEDPEKVETALDWDALARFPGTLVLYMGVKNLPVIAERLAAAGRDPAEPAAAIERGTQPGQRTVTSTLAGLPDAVTAAGIGAPAILLFGPVAARRESIAWLERRPLWGRRVVVTRARAQASGLAATLRELGADVVELPAIRIESLLETEAVRDAVADLHTYALVVLTSPNGARLLFEAMAAEGRDARALANATVAAIGPGTARALAARGVIADLVPESYVAEALVETLTSVDVTGRPVLVARAAQARDVIPEALAERGAEVDVVALYETVREPADPQAVEAAQSADYVTFTSSSTVRNLLEAVGDRFPSSARVVSIGPVTTETARELGLEVAVEAERHDIEGLVEAVLADAAPAST